MIGARATVERPMYNNGNMFRCRLKNGRGIVDVTYTSPYGGWQIGDEESVGGGVIAVPDPTSEVYIFKTDEESGWLYGGTIIVSNPSAQSGGGEDPNPDKNPIRGRGGENYKDEAPISGYRGIPQMMTFENPMGTGLSVSHRDNDENISHGVNLHTFDNKKVSLHITDDNDCIEMETMYHDRIKLTQDEVDNAGAQELHIETESNQNYHSETGKIWIEVTEGLDIDIRNNSGGASKIPVSEEEFGNINLISRNMDINLTAEGRKEFIGNGPGGDYTLGSNVSGYDASTSYVDENGDPINPTLTKPISEEGGHIFIQALGADNDKQLIQIYSKDKLMVYGTGEVYFRGDKVFIQAEDDLDISSKKNISIHTPGEINIDAKKIHLNGGFSPPPPLIEDELENNHLGVGKTPPDKLPIKVNWLQPPDTEEEE
jgi:hypothetical protein